MGSFLATWQNFELSNALTEHSQNEIIADKFEAVYIQALILNWILVIYKFTET